MKEQLLESVRSKYGAVAESTLSSKYAEVKAVVEAFGYSEAELTSIPAEAHMGLSCGNPTTIASIRSGEVIVDLGSGGGMDVFLASPFVPGLRRDDWPLPDPKGQGIESVRQIRDEIKRRILQLLAREQLNRNVVSA